MNTLKEIAARIKRQSERLAITQGGISATDAQAIAEQLNREAALLETMDREPVESAPLVPSSPSEPPAAPPEPVIP